MNELLVSVGEAARRLSLGRSLLFELLASGAIKSVKIGRRRLVSAQALADFVRHQEEISEGGDG